MATFKYIPAAVAAAALLAFSSMASAKTCQLEIEGTDQMTFNKKELAVAGDCTEVQLTLKHTGKMPVTAMGHNWVLTETKDMQAMATAGMSAGATKDYVKEDPKILAHTKLITSRARRAATRHVDHHPGPWALGVPGERCARRRTDGPLLSQAGQSTRRQRGDRRSPGDHARRSRTPIERRPLLRNRRRGIWRNGGWAPGAAHRSVPGAGRCNNPFRRSPTWRSDDPFGPWWYRCSPCVR